MTDEKRLHIFGVPMDLGQRRSGVDMGPNALRYAGLSEQIAALGYQVVDHGDVFMKQIPPPARIIAESEQGNAHYLSEISILCQQTYDQIQANMQPHEYALFLGGDHSMSIGTVAAVAQQERVGVLWIDAHGDINTPDTSASGNIHGMSVAALLGDGPSALTDIGFAGAKLLPQQVAMIGVRDLDLPERRKIAKDGILVHTMRDVDEMGMYTAVQHLLTHFKDFDHIHVSLDLDSCDPALAPGVGTPVKGGFTYREAHLLMEMLADSGKVRTVDIVEVNPILDHQNMTAKLGVELVSSLLGLRIL